jgi:hypothetical protein
MSESYPGFFVPVRFLAVLMPILPMGENNLILSEIIVTGTGIFPVPLKPRCIYSARLLRVFLQGVLLGYV